MFWEGRGFSHAAQALRNGALAPEGTLGFTLWIHCEIASQHYSDSSTGR